ncbi:MAG TPA: SufD family Fe-S cluster assembly protein [Solirubrobacteraceae bacterium]|jgi:Fe-S cluster assembly protein SufD|nr:SufD family Fe-S cluster assembly protein [Solirubrobacteraceae bacterium]
MSDGNGSRGRPAPRSTKPGAARQATLYRPLAGAGAGNGRAPDELRAAALAVFEAAELPAWRRSGFWTTSLRDLALDQLAPHHPGPDAAVPDVVSDAVGDEPLAGRLVQLAGDVVDVHLDPELAERGVILCSLEEAFERHGDLARRYFMRRLTYERDKFEAAAAAFWTGGAFLYVPPGLTVERPFQILYAIEDGGTAQYAHTLAIGDRGSDFRLREYDLAAPFFGQALHAGHFELYLEAAARCRLLHLQDWSAGDGEVYDVSTHFVRVARDAHCTWIPIHLGGRLTRQHLELSTAEPGADMRHRGIYFTEASEHLDLYTVDLHESGHTTGDTVWKGAATGASRASYEGLIKIDPGAQESHTYLQTHSMMLSPRAKVDAIPSLIVETDSVSASHGGTVGEVDEGQIFYMRTRGLSRQEAVRVIVEGYFEPIVVQLEDPALEALVRERIAAKLAAAAQDIDAYAAAR